MKSTLTALCILLATTLLPAQEPEDKRFVVIPVGDLTKDPVKPEPLFFSTTVTTSALVGTESTTADHTVTFRIHQGKPETLSLALTGTGEVESVGGDAVKDWSVRIGTDGARFLDIRPAFTPETPPAALTFVIKTRAKSLTTPTALLLPAPGPSTGFAITVDLATEPGTDLRVSRADGLIPADSRDAKDLHRFIGYGPATLEVLAIRGGYVFPELELVSSRLTGKLAADGNSIAFHLSTTARAQKEKARADLASSVALTGDVSGDGWHAVLRDGGYDIVAERAGDIPVEIDFVAPVKRRGDWRVLDFRLPAGVVVPLSITGLADGVSFDSSQIVVPVREGDSWGGFLPADGVAALAWRQSGAVADGALFFSSNETTDVRVGSGLMRQHSRIGFRILQGKLGAVNMRLDGPGEILGVDGANVLGWKVTPGEDGTRTLAVTLGKPFENRTAASTSGAGSLIIHKATYAAGDLSTDVTRRVTDLVRDGQLSMTVDYQLLGADPSPGWIKNLTVSYTLDGVRGTKTVPDNQPLEILRPTVANGKSSGPADDFLTVRSQAALENFPVRATMLRITPEATVRHSGFIRVANEGAVRIDVADARGLIQLAPGQFPGRPEKGARQVLVYRFPSADYGYIIQADQVLPEVGVTEVTVYEIAETDRRITSDLELDIREAPLREWEMEIPADHAVASVTGAQVADYAVGTEVSNGRKRLKIIFQEAVANRQLVSVRLEKSEAAAAGFWQLQPLGFPGAKSRRGYIGAVAIAGYRLQAAADGMTGVAEVPVTFFPRKTPGLQQSFRLREGDWKIGLTVEALGQSVQADVFHLYSLKAGAAYGSVLINYFVVGAPATEWRVSVPEAIGNIEVTGQNVGLDWRREGNTVIVPLSRAITGAGTVLLTFEQPMNARGGTLSPGEVRPLQVQAERGYVQVVSPLQVKFPPPSNEGALLAIDASELPTEFRLLSSAPTLAAWQYTARDFKIGMNVEWFEPGETVGQAIDFLKLATKVSRDGEWVTDAGFFVKSRGRSGLRTILPEGAELWEAKVGGQAVNARDDGNALLIPLPPKTDPNEAVEVSLRYGARGADASRVTLGAPVLDAPVVIGEWNVTGDEGRQLVPHGGTAEPVGHVLSQTGWEWLAANPSHVSILIFLGIAAIVLTKIKGDITRGLALIMALAFIILSLSTAWQAANSTRPDAAALHYSIPVMASGNAVVLEIGNVSPWLARMGWGTWLLFLSGVVLFARAAWVRNRWFSAAGLTLLAAAFLSIRGGAPAFFIVAAIVALVVWAARARKFILGKRPTGIAQATAAILFLTVFAPQDSQAAPVAPAKPAESMIHDWRITDGRLRGTVDISVRAETGDRFLLLREPVVLGGFEGSGLRLVQEREGDGAAYFLVAEAAGKLTGKATFEMPMASPEQPWLIPSGPAAMRQVTIRWNRPGWEFFSNGAASATAPAGLTENESGTVMVLVPSDPGLIASRPKQRDATTEETRYFTEVSNLFLPGPGVVNGRHRVSVRPAQGRVSSLVMKVPEGFTVSDVLDGPVGAWRFDPEKRELRVPVDPAQDQAFSFTVESQRGAGSLPMDLDLSPLRVENAAGEVGLLAIAFGDEAQPESIRVDAMSRVNPEDFDGSILPHDAKGQPLVVLQNAFRYGAAVAAAHVRVAPVAAELRSESWQLVSLGEDRLTVSSDLTVSITRSGVFRLSLAVPPELEIETATGEGLSHWTESRADGRRIVTLHLAARSTGRRTFQLVLTGRPPGSLENWQVPRLSLLDASRETGIVTVVPERGLQVRAVDKKYISQLDPRELSDAPEDSARAAVRPGALVYRMLQGDWSLGLAISRLDPWVTARVFHDATLREGQVLTRVGIDYKIENAALKTLRLRIPGLDTSAAATVRASGPAVADLLPVEGQPGLWEVQFQRGVAGETRVDLEYQRAGTANGTELIEPVMLEQVRQLNYFAAIRAGGRLELESATLPRGWQRTDWAVVQSSIGQPAGDVAPLMSFRVADPQGPLPVTLKRHQLADQQKLRVAKGNLTTLLSATGQSLTAVQLEMQVTEKGTLRLKLPAGAALFNVLVNEEGAPLVKEGDDWLFHVFPSPESGRPAAVRFVYSANTGKGHLLNGPVLDVPMENLTWRVIVPEGWRMAGHGGDFELRRQASAGTFSLEDYRSVVRDRKESESRSAVALLDQANKWLSAGDQERASNAFSNAVRSNQLDAASGEDARVQLRELKTQQAVLGLNTRRQKLQMDNGSVPGAAANVGLERAAGINPVMRGRYNFDPKQFDRFLEGNTADENAALKEIANRIVTQQLAAEPAPVALDVTLPERGTIVTFGRSVQTDGKKPMSLALELKRADTVSVWLPVTLCLLLGGLAMLRRPGAASVL